MCDSVEVHFHEPFIAESALVIGEKRISRFSHFTKERAAGVH
jgi:hypothetical protein